MIKAGRELGLTFVPFPEGGGRIPERTLLYMRNTHLRIFELGGPRTPYRLRPEESRNPDDLSRLLSETYSNYNGTNPNVELFTATTIDGVPLYLQSYTDVIQKTGISLEARRYIKDNNLFQSGFGPEQCLENFPNARRGFENIPIQTGLPPFVTVPTGMNSFPAEFMRQFLLSNPISNPQFLSALDSVLDVQSSKIFLIYNYPWWLGGSHNFTFTHSDLPYRQSYNWGISRTGKAVLLISYTDTHDVPFWSRLQNTGNIISKRYDETRVTDEVVKQAHLQLSRVYNRHVNSIPDPIDGMMFVWNKYPYNGGWVGWKPGSRWYDIKRYLTRPFLQENIYINHGYWGAEHNGWGESSLEAADDVLSFFNIPSYLQTN
uniref:Aplysianin-A n=1 Tax=Magallana gigas TaxID=29159 RepID=K1PX82_MAGGI